MSQQMRDRLASAAESLAMAREAVVDEQRRRDELVLDARREGMSYAQIARAARVTRARVMHIIGERAHLV